MKHLQTIFHDKLLHVTVNQAHKLLHATWLSQPSSSEYRANVSYMTKVIHEIGIERVLLDVRKRCYIALSDQNWVLQKVMPLFRKNHYRLAYLVNTQNLELMDTYRLQKEVRLSPLLQNSISLDLFLDEEEAQQWLLGSGTVLSV